MRLDAGSSGHVGMEAEIHPSHSWRGRRISCGGPYSVGLHLEGFASSAANYSLIQERRYKETAEDATGLVSLAQGLRLRHDGSSSFKIGRRALKAVRSRLLSRTDSSRQALDDNFQRRFSRHEPRVEYLLGRIPVFTTCMCT